MPDAKKFEKQFFAALRDIFVGAKIEGDSGYINLMRIKSRYYEQGVFPQLQRDINEALKPFPDFREELFDKLYTFFQRYFSESGSIYFRYTALHQNVYERVYTDDRDVMLFWKTHMLYYVKTDRIFVSLAVEVDGVKFYFDANSMTLKKSNERREVVYSFRKAEADGTLVFEVGYSEKGKTTKVDEILKAVKQAGTKLSDETLDKACRVFEKQSEVDYFINKNARAFLQEQFDLWMCQYLFAGQNVWAAERLAELQALKAIAFKVIDFISQFEDELVKIWNKPKFVRNSHYIITLDKLMGCAVLAQVLAHPGLAAQVQEWRDLGMLGEDFRSEMLTETDLTGAPLYPKYRYLPLDTRYFPDLELNLLALFEDLDAALDGWVIHSENYQAINSLQPKFQEKIQCIHIDPPYNTTTSGFMYANTYLHSSWLTMMSNRVQMSTSLLTPDGSFLCHIDENEYERLHLLFGYFSIPDAGTIVWDKRNPMNAGRGIATQHEYIVFRSKQETPVYLHNKSILSMLQAAAEIINKNKHDIAKAQKEYASWVDNSTELSGGEKAYRFLDEQGRIYQSVSLRAPEPRTDPKFFQPLIHPVTGKPCPVPLNGFSRTPETLQSMVDRNEIIFGIDETIQPRQKMFLTEGSKRQLSSVIQEARKGKAELLPLGLDFPYCHPTALYEHLLGAVTSVHGDIIFDFFAGSGTTAHAVMNLNREDGGRRKYILVEMGDHFHTVILPRIKKIAFSNSWKGGQANGGQGLSQFVKYYDLEQYEDVLHRAHYADADLFDNPYETPYQRYIFLRDVKMLDALDMDAEQNTVHLHLERLYPDIDLAETLSQRRGKWIRRITPEYVEFQDGERLSLTDPDWQIVKPLIWWA